MVFKVLLLVVFFLWFMVYIHQCIKEDFVDLVSDKTFEDLYNWRLANPCVCVGDSFYAKELVLKRIEALEMLWKVCRFLKRDDEQIASLYAMLNSHWNPPGKRKGVKNTARKMRAVLILRFSRCSKSLQFTVSIWPNEWLTFIIPERATS